MWNKPTEKQLEKLPSTEQKTKNTGDKIILMHFFIGGCDWYATEYYPEEKNFFGFAILNGDLQNAEWGYFNLDELNEIKISGLEIDRDKYWKIRKASDVNKIVQANGIF